MNSDLASMQLAMETNFWGPLRVLRAAAPLMPKDGERAAPACRDERKARNRLV